LPTFSKHLEDINVFSRFFSRFSSASSKFNRPQPSKCVEQLETRCLFNAPHVTNVIADNRGEVIFQMDHDMDPTTVNSRSVFMHMAGLDGKFGTIDDLKITGRVRYFAGNRRITFRTSALPVNATYSMKLNSKRIKGADGSFIDGDFNGASVASGNGIEGGDFLMLAKKTTASQTARFSFSTAGAFNVSLFTTQTPKNAANFTQYANTAAWDGSFIHRSVPAFIVQGGGFNITKTNTIGQTADFTPVDNEPHITSNTRGTIALARPDDNNPATDDKGSNQWFFNLADNSSNLDNQNGGFTAFGQITTDAGLAVVDAIAGKTILNAGGVFSALPVENSSTTVEQVAADPAGTLVLLRRVAMLNKVVAYG